MPKKKVVPMELIDMIKSKEKPKTKKKSSKKKATMPLMNKADMKMSKGKC